jgi:uncharacterized cupin superfamily protein
MADEWFVRNLADAQWKARPGFGKRIELEPGPGAFDQLGVRVAVLQAGDRSTYYHAETGEQEGFLVLEGAGLAIVEDQEVPVRQWDYLHCPSGTNHVFVNDTDSRLVLLMLGTRNEDATILYPVSELALKYEAGVRTQTDSPGEAYAALPPWEPTEPDAL